ncbi:MAG: thermonuclease family protein, partial [Bradyrhizobium sp.]
MAHVPLFRSTRWIRGAIHALITLAAAVSPGHAAPCMFAEQGDGHVSAIIDARSFRLSDGREIRLAGIEAPPPERRAASIAALGEILRDRDVVL